jgi:hypothetical protein
MTNAFTKRTMLPILIALVGSVLMLALLHVHLIRDGANGDLVWNANDAYLFIHSYRRGWDMTYLQYARAFVKESLGSAAPTPSDQRSRIIVFRITPETVQQHVEENMSFDFSVPIDSSVYLSGEGGLAKWSLDRLEHVSSEEQKSLVSLVARAAVGGDFTDVNGWSTRYAIIGRHRETRYPITLGGKSLTLVVKEGRKSSDVSLDLLLAAKVPKRIWCVNLQPRKVTRAEYVRDFAGP